VRGADHAVRMSEGSAATTEHAVEIDWRTAKRMRRGRIADFSRTGFTGSVTI
jgi:hypothetical protein